MVDNAWSFTPIWRPLATDEDRAAHGDRQVYVVAATEGVLFDQLDNNRVEFDFTDGKAERFTVRTHEDLVRTYEAQPGDTADILTRRALHHFKQIEEQLYARLDPHDVMAAAFGYQVRGFVTTQHIDLFSDDVRRSPERKRVRLLNGLDAPGGGGGGGHAGRQPEEPDSPPAMRQAPPAQPPAQPTKALVV